MALFDKLQLLHKTSRRIRVRYASSCAVNAEALKRYLELKQGFETVSITPTICTVTVHFRPDEITASGVMDELKALQQDGFTKSSAETEGKKTTLNIVQAVTGLVLVPLLPLQLRTAITAVTCFVAIAEGSKDLFKGKITSEVMEAAAMVISIARNDHKAALVTNLLVTVAQAIEHHIEQRSDELLLSLVKPDIEQVWIKKGDQEILVPTNSVVKGDVVIAQTGSTVAVDGVVLSGEASISEASMTGESVPVAKSRGDRVISGSVVEDGRIEIYAEGVGTERAIFRIGEYVQNSLKSKSNTQLEASRLADKLVPVSFGLSAGTYLFTQSFEKVAAILQADYSCSLKLATPVAFKSAMYNAGSNNILIKSAQALEKLAEVDLFIFDKTGTVTSGELEVFRTDSLDPAWKEDEILCLAASIEEHYFHPIAQAVVKAAQKSTVCTHFHHSEVEFIVAHGVCAYVDGKKIAIGSKHYLTEHENIDFSKYEKQIKKEIANGLTPLYISQENRLLGIVWLRDEIRSDSAELIKKLRSLGVKKIVMLTGDVKEKALEIANELGFDECHYELKPDEKASIVMKYKDKGFQCAFVGDGINDAPALTASSVGIAMQKGSDIARISSDIALMRDDILLVADARALAIKTVKKVKENYRLTVGINSTILMLASFGYLSSVSTAFLHNFTTIAMLARAATTKTKRA